MCSMNVVCVLCSLVVTLACVTCLQPPCDSDIYCYGDLLHVVQTKEIYADSKYFVDMKMKQPRNETLEIFREMMNRTNQNPDVSDVEKFVQENFDEPGSEFENWDPVDWTSNPKFLENIKDSAFLDWAIKLNEYWKELGRKMKDEVKDHPELYSIIYVPNPVIVPGGRFREFYYWDSYWIVRGLLLSEMNVTVKGMLENFLHMVETYGFIPNGGRIYYTQRSQPPLLIPMVESYLNVTKDLDFLKKHIDTLEKEFLFWMTNHTVTINKDDVNYTLARYTSPSSGPRPESYKEDYKNAQFFKTEAEKQDFYCQLKTAAESGWDFSTRWFIHNSTNTGNITDTKPQFILPVDLNAILYWNARLLSKYYDILGKANKSLHYKHLADDWIEAVTKVLWHEEVGMWLDYDILNGVKRNSFHPSNLAPLWTGCFNQRELKFGKIMKYLERSGMMMFEGGIPTSSIYSLEQWDYPNAWPPLQYIVIMGLEATGDLWAQNLALEITKKWVRSNFKTFDEHKVMYEKYDATNPGGHGTGGEYKNQIGFGWTNGVILELLDKYGHILEEKESFPTHYYNVTDVKDPSAQKAPQNGAETLRVVQFIWVLTTMFITLFV